MLAETQSLLHTTVDSPIGELLLVGDGEALRGLYMQDGPRPMRILESWATATEPFAEASEQLGQYFAGERTEFDRRPLPSGDRRRRDADRLRRRPRAQALSARPRGRDAGDPLSAPAGAGRLG